MAHDDERTPPDPFPALRAGDSERPVDLGHLFALQKWLASENREMRRQHGDAMNEVRQRLTGIEGQLGDGKHKLEKHDDQLRELIDQVVEAEKRISAIEVWKYADLGTRMQVLEDAELARTKRETADAARREALASADAAHGASLRTRMRDGFLVGTVSALGGSIIVGAIAFAWWLFSGWVKAGSP